MKVQIELAVIAGEHVTCWEYRARLDQRLWCHDAILGLRESDRFGNRRTWHQNKGRERKHEIVFSHNLPSVAALIGHDGGEVSKRSGDLRPTRETDERGESKIVVLGDELDFERRFHSKDFLAVLRIKSEMAVATNYPHSSPFT